MKNSPSSSSLSSLSSSTTSSTSSPSSPSSSIGSNPGIITQLSPKPKLTKQTKRTAKKNVKDPAENGGKKNAKSCSSAARRSSIYRGVTRHRWTGRFEAHLWDKHTWNNIQNKKGRQVYLGAYDSEEAAARTYDLAALKYWGPDTSLNFPIETYQKELEEMHKLTKEEYLASLRRQSSGFSRGVSKYRGVARHHHNGRWEARIGRVLGNKYLYLGTYSTQEEAAAAYDMAAIQYRGASAVTNFDISNYADYLKQETTQLPTDQQPQLPNLNSQTNIQQEVQQQQQQQQKQQHQDQEEDQQNEPPEMVLPQLLLPSYDSSSTMAMMDQLFNERDFSNWSLCLDVGFNPHLVPDVPFEMTKPGELPDLFYDTGFEDNIVDFIFEGGVDENEVKLACGDNKGCFGSYGGFEEKGKESLPSSSSSSSSTTTLMGFV